MDGNQVPQELVSKVGETFERILQEVFSSSIPSIFLLSNSIMLYFLYYCFSLSLEPL